MLNDIFVTVLAALVSGIIGYLFSRAEARPAKTTPLQGRALAYSANYPVVITKSRGRENIRLDMSRFALACKEVLRSKNQRAAADLIYLYDHNVETVQGHTEVAELMRKVKRRYRYQLRHIAGPDQQRKDLLDQLGRVIDGLGQTFAGVPFEFVLHDTRNPMHSVYDIVNPITGRRVGSPASSLIRRYIINHATYGGLRPYVGYRIPMPDGRELKGTTIPIEHPVLGLVAFLCINIDIEKFKPGTDWVTTLKSILDALTSTPSGTGKEQFFVGDEEDEDEQQEDESH